MRGHLQPSLLVDDERGRGAPASGLAAVDRETSERSPGPRLARLGEAGRSCGELVATEP